MMRGKYEQTLFDTVTKAAQECKDRSLGLIASTCTAAGISEEDKFGRKVCRDSTEAALDEVVLVLENQEETGIRDLVGKSVREALKFGLERGIFVCESSYSLIEKTPEERRAEREHAEKEFGKEAVRIVDRLVDFFGEVSGLEEIPRVERVRQGNKCKAAVRSI